MCNYNHRDKIVKLLENWPSVDEKGISHTHRYITPSSDYVIIQWISRDATIDSVVAILSTIVRIFCKDF